METKEETCAVIEDILINVLHDLGLQELIETHNVGTASIKED